MQREMSSLCQKHTSTHRQSSGMYQLKVIMGHIITLSHCRDAALHMQSESCIESRITVFSVNNMFKQLSGRNQFHHVTSKRSDSPTSTNTQKHCIRQYLPKNTGRPRMHQIKWCKPVRERESSFCSILLTQSELGVGVFIKEMTDHNISLIGLNRNATTILQITPWWGKCN